MALDYQYFIDGGGAGAGTYADPDQDITTAIAGTVAGAEILAIPKAGGIDEGSATPALTDRSLVGLTGKTKIFSGATGGFITLLRGRIERMHLENLAGASTDFVVKLTDDSSIKDCALDANGTGDCLIIDGNNTQVENVVLSYENDGDIKTDTGGTSYNSIIKNVVCTDATFDNIVALSVDGLFCYGDLVIGDSATCVGRFNNIVVRGDITIDSSAEGGMTNYACVGTVTNYSSNFELASAGTSKEDIAKAMKDQDVSSTSAVAGSVYTGLNPAGSRKNSRFKDVSYDANGNPTSYEEHFYPTANDASADTNADLKLSVQTTYDTNSRITSRLITDIT